MKETTIKSVQLVATRVLVNYCRRISKNALDGNIEKFGTILDELTNLLDTTSLETVYLPIEAFLTFSKTNEDAVAVMAPKITPKLLSLFKQYHSEGVLGSDLIFLFKQWC